MLKIFNTMKIKHKITLLAISIIILILFFVGLIMESIMVNSFEDQMAKYAMGIAHTTASMPIIQENVGLSDGYQKIQPVAEKIRKNTDAEFVVVIDMERKRYSHPVPERIGKTFVGGDEKDVLLLGKEYTSMGVGTLGPSLRAFVPIFRDGEQVGAVAVGIMLTAINNMLKDLTLWILTTVFLALVIGFIGANLLADNIKNAMYNLEPYQIAAILQEREAILDSVREGIIAVDKEGKIVFLNNEARRILDLSEHIVGKDIREQVPNTRLHEIIKTGKSEYDEEQNIKNARILTNRVPIKVNNKVVGAIASFRDMTEIQTMAQELTGVKRYVEALRVHNHEFSNKLHTILGLIQLQEYEKAVKYISQVTDYHQDLISFVNNRIKEPAVAGILLGKWERCRELGIDFKINKNSNLAPLQKINFNDLVVIIGNLIENSMEAVQLLSEKEKKIIFSIYDESNKIFISVKDCGKGIAEEIENNIFEKGFSTKSENKRGYGLYLVKSLVDYYKGEINVEVNEKGTEFIITIPNEVE